MQQGRFSFWSSYNDLIVKLLVMAFALSIAIVVFIRPVTILNYSTVISDNKNVKFQVIVRDEDQLDLLILYADNPAIIDEWDSEVSTRFVLDTAQVVVGSQVNVIDFSADSSIAKVEYTNPSVFRKQKRTGFMLAKHLSIEK